MSKKQKKDKAARSTRQLMGIEEIKDYCIATRMGNLVFFIIKPTNISVLPDSSISARIYALLNVVKGQAEIEMLALNSKESFERNKDFYRERLSQEELPAVRRLLEQDSKHLDRIQVLMASSREFYIIIRLRGEQESDVFSYGYLKKPLKQLVDTIVDALAELPEVSECYEVWNQIHEELNECYGHNTPWERLPLSQRKEFRKIKNDIIREAENIRLGLPTFEDERMQDEPEPESQKEEHQSYSVYEQAQRYRAAKAVLQDIYALDAEHAGAVKALEQLWEEGYTVAAHQLGKFYRDDLSTLRDHAKAEQWFRRSAEAGNDFSEYALGKLLLTQKRWDEAMEWLDKAADHGSQFAQYRLGKIYLTGEFVPKDVEKALAYLTASADQENQFAQYALGKLYLFGRDVPPDRKQAREWLIRAAAQGNEYARFFLDRFDQFRDPSVMLAATKLLHHMSRIFQSNSVPPSNPAGIRIDSKRRRRLMEKRMAMGHKADDHEEQTQYQQSM